MMNPKVKWCGSRAIRRISHEPPKGLKKPACAHIRHLSQGDRIADRMGHERELTPFERQEALDEVAQHQRPCTRGECVYGPRPCPWVSCRYHLYLDVNPETGAIKYNFPGLEVWELKETCALDVADRYMAGCELPQKLALKMVGRTVNISRERVRQIVRDTVERFRAALEDSNDGRT